MDSKIKRSVAMLGLQMSLADMVSKMSGKAEPVTLTIDAAPTIDEKMLEYNAMWPGAQHPLPMAPLSSKERARRKKRRQMAKESRRRNRRK